MDLRVVLTICAVIWTSPSTVAGDLTCRRCIRAASLGYCTNVTCSDQESCYTDQMITELYTIEFNAGCRAKDVCSVGGHTIPIGKRSIEKRSVLMGCSRCCDTEAPGGCNAKLCGIGLHLPTQCYSCDHSAHSDQGNVRDPRDCITSTTCRSDEVCYAQQSLLGTTRAWAYGCFQKRMCELLTPPMLADFKRCYIDKDKDACGFAKRSEVLCTVCCGYDSCNYGTCEDIKLRLYNLYASGYYNTTTLKLVNYPLLKHIL